MGKLVQVMGVGHQPALPRMLSKPDPRPGVQKLAAKFSEFRRRLSDARPDVLILISHDHLNQWFMNNMPAFLVGKAPSTEGPFDYQEARLGVPYYKAAVDVDVAKSILSGGLQRGIDFAYSDEFRIDHAYVVPLTLLRPEMDLPIVPIFVNCFAPPVPTASRCYEVGEKVRAIIDDELPADKRVAVIASGHLGIELGGPRLMDGPLDAEWELQVTDFIRRGDVEGILQAATPEKFISIGNYTSGFIDYVMTMGVARAHPASSAECVFSHMQTMAFFSWDFHQGLS